MQTRKSLRLSSAQSRQKSLPWTQFSSKPQTASNNIKTPSRVNLKLSSPEARVKEAARPQPVKISAKVIGQSRIYAPQQIELTKEEIDDAYKSQVSIKTQNPVTPSSRRCGSRQSKLEFRGRLSFTQEENKEEFADAIVEQKKQSKKKQLSLSSVSLENIPIQVATLLSDLGASSDGSPLLELTLHDSKILARDCLLIAQTESLDSLKILDLSCNPFRLEGLCNLLGEKTKLGSLVELELYSCGIEAPNSPTKCFNKKFRSLPDLEKLNLSHNNLSGLLHLINGPYKLFGKQLETLLLINVNQDRFCDFQPWLIQSLRQLTGLYELHVSDNYGLQIDVLLRAVQQSASEEPCLQTICAVDCTVSNEGAIPIDATLEDGLYCLTRLDIAGSLSTPEHLRLVTESTALSHLEYLNISKCVIDAHSFQALIDSESLRFLEVLGMAQMILNKADGHTALKVPKRSKFARQHKLKAIDLRQNSGVTHQHLAKTNYLDAVMIFAWQKKLRTNALMPYINKSAESLMDPQTENVLIPQERALLRLPRNPLHIFVPTEEQIELAESLFGL